MTIEEALKTLKENCCAMCAYGSPDMDSCDISSCDNKDAIQALEKEPFMNKPCVSAGVCEHDKIQMLEKLRAEIEQITDTMGVSYNQYVSKIDVLQIIDKYRNGGCL